MMLALILNSLVVAGIVHALIPSFRKASIASAVIANVSLHIVGAAKDGFVDKYVLVAFLITGAYALVISCGVGLVFYVIRRTRPA